MLKLKKCLGTFLKSTIKQRNQNTSFKQLTITPEKKTTTKSKLINQQSNFSTISRNELHFQHLTSLQLFLEILSTTVNSSHNNMTLNKCLRHKLLNLSN